MDKFLIKGPCKLKGQVSISGSKKLMLNHMGREKLCVYLELVLRYYNDIKHDNKIWFLHYKT